MEEEALISIHVEESPWKDMKNANTSMRLKRVHHFMVRVLVGLVVIEVLQEYR